MNHHAFLQAIREDPDDDLLRLAYADFFEEQGDTPRAEMIRVQIELTRGVAQRAKALTLLRRLRELIIAHRAAWLGPLKKVVPDAVFERGFVEEVRAPAQAVLEHAGAILGPHPVTRLMLEHTGAVIGDLAASSYLDGVRMLSLRDGGLRDTDADALARSPYLGSLRVLILDGNSLSAAGLAALLRPANLPRLEDLRLARNSIGDNLGAVVAHSGLPGLRRLDLSGNHIGGRGAELLAGPSWLSGLRALSVANNRLGPADVERLAASPHLAGLESLTLYHYRLPPEVARRLRERYGPRVQV